MDDKEKEVMLTKEREYLLVEFPGEKDAPKLRLYLESETEFFHTDLDAQVSFIKDADGKVTGFMSHQSPHPDSQATKIK